MKALLFLFMATVLLVASRCQINNLQAGSGSQTTNSNCVGMIYKNDRSVAVGAVVRLIPSGYYPASHSAGVIETTSTDSKGRYSFTVTKSDFYNILAEQANTACMQDSVPLSAEKDTTIRSDTLEETGRIYGKVSVKPGSDPERAVILFPGTEIYTTPFDSLGNFITPMLPARYFNIKIFTTEDGYGILDTSMSVFSGGTAELNVYLPISNTPFVNDFKVVFDSATMMAKMHWAPIDTSLIRSFALYRSMAVNRDTVLMLDKTLSTYTDDLVLYNRDTIVYELAAIGRNYKEGYKAAYPKFVACGKVNCNTTIDSGILPSGFGYGNSYSYYLVYADSLQNTYWKNKKSIVKLGPYTTRLREYILPVFDSAVNKPDLAKKADTSQGNVLIVPDDDFNAYGDLRADNANRLFCLAKAANEVSTTAAVVIKLDADLNAIDTMAVPRDSNETMSTDLRMVVTGNGVIYLLWTGNGTNGTVNNVAVYDPDFHFKRKFTIDKTLHNPKCFGDTIVALTYEYNGPIQSVPSTYTINVFDTSLTFRSSFTAIDPADTYCSPMLCDGYGNYSQVILMPGNMYIATINSGKYSYIFFDFKGNIRARVTVPSSSWCFFIDRHTMYQNGPNGKGSTFLEKYSVESLFAK